VYEHALISRTSTGTTCEGLLALPVRQTRLELSFVGIANVRISELARAVVLAVFEHACLRDSIRSSLLALSVRQTVHEMAIKSVTVFGSHLVNACLIASPFDGKVDVCYWGWSRSGLGREEGLNTLGFVSFIPRKLKAFFATIFGNSAPRAAIHSCLVAVGSGAKHFVCLTFISNEGNACAGEGRKTCVRPLFEVCFISSTKIASPSINHLICKKMSTLEALSLPGEDALPTIKVHPTVVFSILNHFSRRSDLEARVIGTLLGTKTGNVIEITNCYGVPFVEEEDEIKIKINQDYHKQMYTAHRRINRKEEILGWYSTTAINGAYITNTSSVINSFYAKQCDDEMPIHLVVDSTLGGDTMGIRAFMAKPITLGDATFADMFEEVKVDLVMSPAESTALYHMMTGETGTGAQDWANASVISAVPTDRAAVGNAVEHLLKTLDELSTYVDDVVSGKVAPNAALGVELSHALSSLQTYKKEELSATLQNKMQDMLMIAYLSTLMKTQLKISEKLHAIV
jgi:translation initiation factor 3 subunit F